MAGSPELRLGISFDLDSFKKTALPSLVQSASNFVLPIDIKFSRDSISEEMRLLGRQLGQRKYRLDLDDTSVKNAIEQVNKLASKISSLKNTSGRASVLGDVLSGANLPQTKALYSSAKGLGIVSGTVSRAKAELSKELKAGFVSAGEDAIRGLIEGILSGQGKLAGLAASLGDELLSALKQSLQIASPSRRMQQIGRQAGQGFNDGLISSLQEATRNAVALVNESLRRLDRFVDMSQRKARAIAPGQPNYELAQRQAGIRTGQRERVQNRGEAIQLRAAAGQFEGGSYQALSKILQSLQLEASEIKPNTGAWNSLQERIASVNRDLARAGRLAEEIQMRSNLGAFAPGSLASLESRLVILKSRAREIAPNTSEWRALNAEIQKAERLVEKATRKPLTKGERFGAAGGAFLYGGGLGGGAGRALGGIAGGLAGGVPGAFTGAAIGQAVDNLGQYAAAIAKTVAEVNKSRVALAGVSRDVADYDKAISAVTQASEKFLLPISQATGQFAKLQASVVGAGFDTETTIKAFNGIASAVIATGGSTEDLNSALRATAQVFSKGKVSAEELRQQIGERIPGAFTIAAQAINKTPQDLDKALQDGKVTLNDFIRFVEELGKRYGSTTEILAKAPENAGARLAVALEQAALTFGNFFQRVGAAFQGYLADLLNFTQQNQEQIKIVIASFVIFGQDLYNILSGVIGAVAPLFGSFFSYIFENFAKGINALARLAQETKAAAGAPEKRAAAAVEALYPDPIERALKGGAAYKEALAVELASDKQSESRNTRLQNLTQTLFKDFKPISFGTGLGKTLPGTGAAGAPDGSKSSSASKLKEFNSSRTEVLQKRLAAEKAALDANLLLSERERSIEKSRLDFKYGNQIIDEQLNQARRTSQEYQLKHRQRFIAEQEQLAAIERKTLESGFVTGIAPELSQGYQNLLDAYDSLTLKQEALTRGKDELNEVEKAEILLNNIRAGLQPEELARVDALASAYLMEARALDLANTSYDKRLTLREALKPLEQQLQLAQILDPKAELRARIRQEKPKLDDQGVEQVARLQEQVNAAQKFETDLQGIASTIGDAFGEAFKGIVTGSMTAREALTGFFRGVADSFADMVANMIAEYLKMQLIEGIMNIISMLSPGFGTGIAPGPVAKSAGVKFSPTKMGPAFANGGIAYGGFTAFASGGIVTGPTLGLVGEGRYNEAVIPLPDGKSVPVQLSGGDGGNQINSNITVNVSNGQAQSNATGSNSSELGRKIEGAVKQVIVGELRPGGLLASR